MKRVDAWGGVLRPLDVRERRTEVDLAPLEPDQFGHAEADDNVLTLRARTLVHPPIGRCLSDTFMRHVSRER
jgi:hypothetical protein